MDQFGRFRSLAAAASRDEPPAIDVTGRVMARIAPEPRRWAVDVPLAVFSGVSVLAASVAAVAAVQAWSLLGDPLGGFFQPLTLVMQ